MPSIRGRDRPTAAGKSPGGAEKSRLRSPGVLTPRMLTPSCAQRKGTALDTASMRPVTFVQHPPAFIRPHVSTARRQPMATVTIASPKYPDLHNYVGGVPAPVEADLLDVYDPSTGHVIARVAMSGMSHVDA